MTLEAVKPSGRGGARAGAGRKSSRDEDAVASAYVTQQKAKAKREAYKAEQAELEVKKLRGELVAVVEVRQQAIQAARTVREAMLALPSRLSAILADQPEPVVRKRMDDEIRKMLETIADEL